MDPRFLLTLPALPLFIAGGFACGEPDSAVDRETMEGCLIEADDPRRFNADGPACERLSDYGFFEGPLSDLQPDPRLIPFDLATPLFSDYAHKIRWISIPSGHTVQYRDEEALEFPVGTVILKTFFYPIDFRDPEGGRRILETRLLVHTSQGWKGYPYLWDDAQAEAIFLAAGGSVPVEWIDADGRGRSARYRIPNINQCAACHDEYDAGMQPLGLKARHLNREWNYGGGPANQLEHWVASGVLDGVPAPESIPRSARWNDATETLEHRARTYLEINCAHCHNPEGSASYKNLELAQSVTDPQKLGLCRLQGSQNAAPGEVIYNIHPGRPDLSRIVQRISSTSPGFMMPRLGRTVRHEEGAALIAAWIAALEDRCVAP